MASNVVKALQTSYSIFGVVVLRNTIQCMINSIPTTPNNIAFKHLWIPCAQGGTRMVHLKTFNQIDGGIFAWATLKKSRHNPQ